MTQQLITLINGDKVRSMPELADLFGETQNRIRYVLNYVLKVEPVGRIGQAWQFPEWVVPEVGRHCARLKARRRCAVCRNLRLRCPSCYRAWWAYKETVNTNGAT